MVPRFPFLLHASTAFLERCRSPRRLQALIVPTLPVPAVRHGESRVRIGVATEAVRTAVWRLAHPFNLTGHPALQIPVGLTRDGLPVGMQIVGAHFAEATVFRVAAAPDMTSPTSAPSNSA